MRRSLLLVPLLLALVAAPAAFGGGFVTVGLSSTPAGTQPGEPWKVDITVLAHGRTPVEGMPSTVRIHNNDAVEEFTTKEIEPGVYRAEVVFPSAGTWSYDVIDGYIRQVHTFPAVEIGGGPAAAAPAPAPSASPAPAADTGGGIATGWLLAAGGLLLLALAVLGFDHRRRHPSGATPEPA